MNPHIRVLQNSPQVSNNQPPSSEKIMILPYLICINRIELELSVLSVSQHTTPPSLFLYFPDIFYSTLSIIIQKCICMHMCECVQCEWITIQLPKPINIFNIFNDSITIDYPMQCKQLGVTATLMNNARRSVHAE